MNWLTITAALLVTLTKAGLPAENPELTPDQTKMLEAIRAQSLQYTENLPNFICTQITHRAVTDEANFGATAGVASGNRDGFAGLIARSGLSSGGDEIDEQLTFFDQTEHYKVVAFNGKKVPGLDHMQFAGAISAGEFGSRLHDLFDTRSDAVFIWDRAGKLRSRPVVVFRFRVPSQNGIIVIDRDTDQKILAAYSGTLYADSESLQVLRITLELDLPVAFPITTAAIEVDYKPISIAGKTYTLPSHSEVRLRSKSRLYVNEIAFKDFHRFAVESTIHYGNENATPNR